MDSKDLLLNNFALEKCKNVTVQDIGVVYELNDAEF